MNNLNNIKKYLKKKNFFACLISSNNQFLNEFIENEENLLKKITNFSGSFGYALILTNKQYLYVDGRYTKQAKLQTKIFTIKDIDKIKYDLVKIQKLKKKILIDPKTFSYNFFLDLSLKNFVFFNSIKEQNKKEYLFFLPKKYSGEESSSKIEKLGKKIKLSNNEIFLINSPENIGWLTNIRSRSKKFSKIFNCIAVYKNKKIYIFSNQKINLNFNKIIFKNFSKINETLFKTKKIFLDKKYTSLFFYNLLQTRKIKFKFIKDPIDNFKSIKNLTEITNIKIAHIFDGIAYIKFLYWLKFNKLKNINEIDCQKKIEFFKRKNKFYLGKSFQTITAGDKNASIIHYNPLDYKKYYLKKNSLLLIDCGSQYYFGTTDMTRTISLGKRGNFHKKIYTLVLKSHISVYNFKITKNTKGKDLDKSARKHLKKIGLDFNHGTGHGVGYLSNVHETPPSLSKFSNYKIYPLQVMSNEPGYYKNNDFGVRLENLIYLDKNREFQNLTLVPFDKSLIIKSMLSKKELKWINDYHLDVYEKIHKFLNNKEKKFLKNSCSKID